EAVHQVVRLIAESRLEIRHAPDVHPDRAIAVEPDLRIGSAPDDQRGVARSGGRDADRRAEVARRPVDTRVRRVELSKRADRRPAGEGDEHDDGSDENGAPGTAG